MGAAEISRKPVVALQATVSFVTETWMRNSFGYAFLDIYARYMIFARLSISELSVYRSRYERLCSHRIQAFSSRILCALRLYRGKPGARRLKFHASPCRTGSLSIRLVTRNALECRTTKIRCNEKAELTIWSLWTWSHSEDC
jgi:hypothetical protein